MSPHPPNGGWSALRRTYPRTVAVLATLIAAFVVGDVLLAARYLRDRAETERLRNGMTDAERQRADMVADAEENKANVMQELVRRRAAADRALHLSVSVDSGTMLLERDGALLREMRVQVGEERLVVQGGDTVRVLKPRGPLSVERVLGARDPWEVPTWVFSDRGAPGPEDRKLSGALGRNALVLSGGTVIYALPDSGVLADSGYVLPGAVRVS
ncbi:MAG: hypothetical protein IT358_02465, partial [Gemmatimonadaceae bacterium]|nr:hypothetical protein [Gemmatimonadaceae bacterium]